MTHSQKYNFWHTSIITKTGDTRNINIWMSDNISTRLPYIILHYLHNYYNTSDVPINDGPLVVGYLGAVKLFSYQKFVNGRAVDMYSQENNITTRLVWIITIYSFKTRSS